MYNLIFVDVDREETTLHRMNVITGDYLTPVNLKGELLEQVFLLIKLIKTDKPDKVIFDKSGYGYPFYYCFMDRANICKEFSVDSFGLIIHKDGLYESDV